jgi:hypothetical protein
MCYQRSKPNKVKCECTDEYAGDTCDKRKLPVHESLKYRAVLVRYMQIDYITLEVILVVQQVLTRLPESLNDSHGNPTAHELVLLTLHYADHRDIYLISLRVGEGKVRVRVGETRERRLDYFEERESVDKEERTDDW